MPEENSKDEKVIKENIQQESEGTDDQNNKPATPVPPQRKHPQAKPESERDEKEKK